MCVLVNFSLLMVSCACRCSVLENCGDLVIFCCDIGILGSRRNEVIERERLTFSYFHIYTGDDVCVVAISVTWNRPDHSHNGYI